MLFYCYSYFISVTTSIKSFLPHSLPPSLPPHFFPSSNSLALNYESFLLFFFLRSSTLSINIIIYCILYTFKLSATITLSLYEVGSSVLLTTSLCTIFESVKVNGLTLLLLLLFLFTWNFGEL